MAVIPFDNRTPEPTLTNDINNAVKQAVESRLGLRPATEETADAIVRGSIVRYDPDVPVQYTGNDQQQQVNVTRRLVQLTVSVEIIDQKANKPIFQQSALLVEGDYAPPNELDGRRKALDKLVTLIVQGAQSQW